MKKNVKRFYLDEITDKNIMVVSKLVLLEGQSLAPFIEGMDTSNVLHIAKTPFDEDSIIHVYYVGEIDMELAIKLGLGVIRVNKKHYLYNAQLFSDDYLYTDALNEEVLRVSIYYQIMNPSYTDAKLELLVNTKGAKELIHKLMRFKDANIITTLIKIFESQKGHDDNILPFNRKKG